MKLDTPLISVTALTQNPAHFEADEQPVAATGMRDLSYLLAFD